MISREEVLRTEFSSDFVRGMQDRMVVSFHKYGYVAESFGKIDEVKSLLVRLARYCGTEKLYECLDSMKADKGDGNTEWLMDVGNFSMIEYMQPAHPKAHYKPTDSNKSPGRAWVDGTTKQTANDAGAEEYVRKQREGD